MSSAQTLETPQDTWEDVIFPPSDLYSDEPPLESDLHLQQMVLLLKCLEWLWARSPRFLCLWQSHHLLFSPST